jgi:hypothetical protein
VVSLAVHVVVAGELRGCVLRCGALSLGAVRGHLQVKGGGAVMMMMSSHEGAEQENGSNQHCHFTKLLPALPKPFFTKP